MTKFYSRKEAFAFWLTVACIVFTIAYSLCACFFVGIFYYALAGLTTFVLIDYLRRFTRMNFPENRELGFVCLILVGLEVLLFQGPYFPTAKIILTGAGIGNVLVIWLLYFLANKYKF